MGARRVTAGAVACWVTAAGMLLLGAAPASAHAALVTTTPSSESVVADPPAQVRLDFSEPMEATTDPVSVRAPDGQVLATRSALDPADAAALTTVLPDTLRPGTYVVTWRVLSIDGHPVHGEFRFAYKRATAPLTPASSNSGTSSVPALALTGRVLAAAGALLVVGLTAFPLLVVAPARRRLPEDVAGALAEQVNRRLNLLVVVAATVAAAGSILVLLDTVAVTNGVKPLAALAAPADLARFVTGTRTGLLLLVRLAALLVIGGSFWIARKGSKVQLRVLSVGFAASLLTILTFSLSSHAASAVVDRPLVIGFDALHLLAAGLWSGGLLALATAALPAAQLVGRDRSQVGDAAAAMSAAFSVLAQLAMLAVLTTGGYLALLQISAVRQLGESAWGAALTVKVALWVTVLLFASANAIAFVPRLAERAASAKRRSAAADQLGSTIRLELLLAAGLVAVAALMSATPPPTTTDSPTSAAGSRGGSVREVSSTGSKDGYSARVTVSRSGSGDSAATVFQVALTTQGTPASAPSAEALLRGPDGVTRSFGLVISAAGEWVSDRLAVTPGSYLMTARIERLGSTVSVPIDVKVPS